MKIMGIVLGGALALGGCGSKEAPNAKNFGAAIEEAMAHGNEFCLGLTIRQWPLKVWVDAPHDGRPDVAGELAALEEAGLVKGGDGVAEPRKDAFGRPMMGALMTVRSYEVTGTGKRFLVEKANGQGGDFCYGNGKLGQIVKWDGPVKTGEVSRALGGLGEGAWYSEGLPGC